MFTGVTLASVLADADTILSIVSPLVVIMVAFWGSRKVWSLVRGATGR